MRERFGRAARGGADLQLLPGHFGGSGGPTVRERRCLPVPPWRGGITISTARNWGLDLKRGEFAEMMAFIEDLPFKAAAGGMRHPVDHKDERYPPRPATAGTVPRIRLVPNQPGEALLMLSRKGRASRSARTRRLVDTVNQLHGAAHGQLSWSIASTASSPMSSGAIVSRARPIGRCRSLGSDPRSPRSLSLSWNLSRLRALDVTYPTKRLLDDAMASEKTATLYRMVLPDHTCPFGVRAKQMLEGAGYEVDDRILGTRQEVDALKAKYGVQTTPQVFIDDERIGGSDDLERALNFA